MEDASPGTVVERAPQAAVLLLGLHVRVVVGPAPYLVSPSQDSPTSACTAFLLSRRPFRCLYDDLPFVFVLVPVFLSFRFIFFIARKRKRKKEKRIIFMGCNRIELLTYGL